MSKSPTFSALQAVARAKGLDVTSVAQRYALERLLGRTFASEHADRFAVKGGALMFLAEGVEPLDGRTTSDVDLQLPAFEGTLSEFEAIMQGILAAPGDDGVMFDLSTWKVKAEREEGSIGGGSVTVTAMIGGCKVRVKLDVAFDDRTHAADLVDMPYRSILGGTPFNVRAVPFAHSCADKVQAMLRHGPKTHRMRDHYDLFVMLTRGGVDLQDVAAALPASLAAFSIPLPGDVTEIPALADEHAGRREAAWEAERQSRRFAIETPTFGDLNARLRELVSEVLEIANAARPALAA